MVRSKLLKGDIMKTKKFWILAGLLLGVIVAICIADDLTFQQRALQDIKTVGVKISILGSPTPLSKVQIQEDIELKLRSCGLKVFSEDKPNALLEVQVVSVPIELGNTPSGWASSIVVSSSDFVRVLRKPKNLTYAMTWLRQFVIAAPFEKFEGTAKKTILDGVNAFINDYLTANPKEQPKDEQKNK